jgi:Zn-dependent membrane protease YugP
MFFDPMYLLFAAPALVVMLYAQWKVTSTYKKYSKIANMQKKSGAEIAVLLLRANGLSHVTVEETGGVLTDHYDPRKKKLRLSKDIYRLSSVSSLGIVAHEVGHAIQDNTGYYPMRLRAALVPAANVGTWLGYGCFFLGIFLSITNLVWVGVILFSAAVIFALVTLPVEFNASSRAKQMLMNNGLVTTAELNGAGAVLSAAALTYVAALLQAVSSLLYYVFVATGMSKRE